MYDPLLNVVAMENVPKMFAALSCGTSDPIAVTVAETISCSSITTEVGHIITGRTAE